MSVGELNHNKNHETVIRALARVNNSDIHYIVAGKGELYDELAVLSKSLGVSEQIHLLGFRQDIADLYAASDCCVLPSIREGLGMAALEGMCGGLPLIASNNRGSKDYVVDGYNAILCKPTSVEDFSNAIKRIYSDELLRKEMSQRNIFIAEKFDLIKVNEKIKAIYEVFRKG